VTRRVANPVRTVHRPDKLVELRTHDPLNGDEIAYEGPLLACLNAVTASLDAGLEVTITPLLKDNP
jgi:hypothetical protein